MGDIDGPALRRWLKAGKDRAARLRGLRLESLRDERVGEIIGGDAAALTLIDDNQKALRVPVAALDHWILADVPPDTRTLIEADGNGLDDESVDALRQNGFVPDQLSRAQCAILLKIIDRPIDTMPSDVQVLERLLQDPKNCSAAYRLLYVVRDRSRMAASTAARTARLRLSSTNPVLAERIRQRALDEAYAEADSLISLGFGSFVDQLAIAEKILERMSTRPQLEELKRVIERACIKWIILHGYIEDKHFESLSNSRAVLLSRIGSRIRELDGE